MIAPFRWNHVDLDRVCSGLSDFSSLLLSFNSGKDLDQLWELALLNLVKNIRAAGLQPFVFDERNNSQKVLDSAAAKAADVLLLRKSKKNADWSTLMQKASSLPGAVILFSEGMPPEWFNSFDLVLEFFSHKCRVFDRSGRPPVESPCVLGPQAAQVSPGVQALAHPQAQEGQPEVFSPVFEAQIPTPAAATSAANVATEQTRPRPTIYCVDLTPLRKNEIVEALGSREIQVLSVKRKSVMDGELTLRTGDVVIIEASENESWLEKFFLQAIPLGVPVIVSARKVKREEDRIALYGLGATLVLSKDLKEGEAIAMIGSMIRLVSLGRIKPQYPFKEWDEEFHRLSEKMKRDLLWKKEAKEELKDYYRPVVGHLFKRSALTATPCGALLVPLPEVPNFIQKSGWSALMQKTLLQSLIATVRQKDITFVFHDRLVLISSDLSPGTSDYVIKRIQKQLEGLEEKASPIQRIVVDEVAGEAIPGTEAQVEKLLNRILDAAG